VTDHRFTPLERAILEAICERNPSDRAALDAQLSSAIVRNRENTGAGFFIYLDVNRDASARITGDQKRSGPEANVAGLQRGMGFILWFDDGYASSLEGYSYEESTKAIDFGAVQFEVIRSS
jgi:hypothetical protein